MAHTDVLMTVSYTVLSIGDVPTSDSFVKPRETLCTAIGRTWAKGNEHTSGSPSLIPDT